MFTLFILKSFKKTLVQRNILTITDVLSDVGGYAEIIILASFFLIKPYQEAKLQKSLIKKLYKYQTNLLRNKGPPPRGNKVVPSVSNVSYNSTIGFQHKQKKETAYSLDLLTSLKQRKSLIVNKLSLVNPLNCCRRIRTAKDQYTFQKLIKHGKKKLLKERDIIQVIKKIRNAQLF